MVWNQLFVARCGSCSDYFTHESRRSIHHVTSAILQRVKKDAPACVSLRPHSTLIIQRDRNAKHLHVSAQVCGGNHSWRLISTLAGSRTPPASARHHTRQFDSTPT